MWIVLLGALLGCDGTRGMGETCSASEECVGDGVCLKGVCSGYTCSGDADCDNGLVCGDVAGVAACVQRCVSDASCLGEQTCTIEGGGGVCL